MIPIRVTVKGLAEEVARLRRTRQLLADLRWLYEAVTHRWWLDHLRAQLASSGAHGGSRWDYAGEPKYAAFKRRVTGRDDVLRWTPGDELLAPSLTDPDHPNHDWTAREDSYSIGSTVAHLEQLLAGGIGPFGEPYPGRDPFERTEDQIADLERREQEALDERLAELGWTVR